MTRLRLIGAFAGVAILIAILSLTRALHTRTPSPEHQSALPGVTLEQVETSTGPALVVTSLKSGARPTGGLKVGDRIERVDRLPAPSTRILSRDLAHRSGPVEIRVWRSGHLTRISVPRHTGA